MHTEGFGTLIDKAVITEEKSPVWTLTIPVPEDAVRAVAYGVASVTAYNDEEGGAGFLYADLYVGDDFGLEMHADFDSGKWNSVTVSNQSEVSVEGEDILVVELHIRADEALKINPDLFRAQVNGLVVFE